jgi:hypothetical protein
MAKGRLACVHILHLHTLFLGIWAGISGRGS